MSEKDKTGICSICSKSGKLTFEHIPPRSAFNDKPIFVQTHIHLTQQNSPLFGKRMTSNKGAGDYLLCKECNNYTGDWYARDFGNFVKQGMAIIQSYEKPQYIVKGNYKIKPLNVIKQILSMFLCIDKSGHLRSKPDLVTFILNKKDRGLPKGYRIYLYTSISPINRMFGYSIVGIENQRIQKWSEITFIPFGYFLTEDSEPAHKHMCEISNFANFEFDKEINFDISTAFLKIDSFVIGTYK